MRLFFLTALLITLLGCGRKDQAMEAAPAAKSEVEPAEAAARSILDPVAGGTAVTKTPAGAARVEYATEESLKEYNKALKAWIDRVSYLPQNVKELSTLRGCPQPPPAPPGRTLVFDKKTWAVHLE